LIEKVSTALSIAGLIGLPIGLIVVSRLISKFRANHEINNDEFEKKFSELIQDDTSSGIVGAYWKVIQLVRWSMTLLIMVFLRDLYYLQI
jgi:hypothetical protein